MNLGVDVAIQEYESIEIDPIHAHDLILDYLVQNCYEETAAAFGSTSDLSFRKSVLVDITLGNIKEAINKLKPLLGAGDKPLAFLLHCMLFIETLRKEPDNILDISFHEFTEPEFQPMLSQVISLVAYECPQESAVGNLLSQDHREYVAQQCNKWMMQREGVQVVGLEQVIRQCTVVREVLHDQKDSIYPKWKLEHFLK